MAEIWAAAIGAAAAIGGAVSSADASRKQAHAAQDAANAATNPATNGTVDIAALDAQARQFAAQNAADSQRLENQFSPGVGQLRNQSIADLIANLNSTPSANTLQNQIIAQAKTPLTIGGPVTYDAPTLRAAIAKANSDLALGGTLDQETQNAATRNALATSGRVSGGLGLGRDLTARDLGLTSLQLENQRLQNAASLGGAEASLNQGNASLVQQQQALGLTAQEYGAQNLFNSANLLSNIDSGNFARILNAATLGQNIAQPKSGLDPSAVANIAIANKNVAANGAQQAAAIQSGSANQQSQLASGLLGTGLGYLQNYLNKPATTAAPSYYTPQSVVSNPMF